MGNQLESNLDVEWVELIGEALELGLTPDEITCFLKEKKTVSSSK